MQFSASTRPHVSQKTYTVFLDSADGKSVVGAPGEYTIQLPRNYQNVSSIRLVSAELPLSFYTISEELGNNLLILREVTDPNARQSVDRYHTVRLPTTCVTTIQALASVLRDTIATQCDGFQCVVEAIGSTLRFASQGPFEFIFPPSENEEWGLGWILGFQNRSLVYTSTRAPNYYHLYPPFPATLFPRNYILMDIAGQNGADHGTPDSTFAKLIIDPFRSQVIHGPESGIVNKRTYSPPLANLNKLQIRFKWHNGKIITFEHVAHSFTFEVESASSI